MSIELTKDDQRRLEHGLRVVEIPDGATHVLIVDSRIISKALIESLDMSEKAIAKPVVVFGRIPIKSIESYQYYPDKVQL